VQAAHAYIRGHHGKRHLPTVLRLVTDAISQFRENRHAKAARTAISFARFTRESANVDFPATEERFWCGLEAGQEVTERPGQLGLQG
jgi:hypothetical protein